MAQVVKDVENEPMFCGFSIVLLFVWMWDWSSSLTSK